MARMPGAIWRPLAANWASQPRMKAYDIFCLHTMVGSLDGTDGYFRASAANGPGYAGTESHFGTGPDGTIYQWQDTDFQAEANGNGNWHVISSENADMGAPFGPWSGSNVPALTPQQVEANARIAAWLYQTHGIPLEQIPDARPGRRGVGVHRLGVPGYMVAGAEQWSTSRGKACPGDRRIAQVPQIIARARQIAGGAPSQQEDDMPSVKEFWYDTRFRGDRNYAQVIHNIEDQVAAANSQIAGLTAAMGKLAEALASGRDDLTADELRDAVRQGIAEGGAAVLAAQETARAQRPA